MGYGFRAALTAIALCGSIAAQAAPLTVDQVIERHIEARGGLAAIQGIRSLVFSRGLYSEPGYVGEGQATMSLMRPYLKLVGDPRLDPDYMEGYDGVAWEWFADPGVVVRTVGDASMAIRHYADVEGPLVDYRGKGHTVRLGEPALIDGRPAYQLIITMMDGYVTEWFIDQQRFLRVASRHAASVHAFGDEVYSETRFHDHRAVAGVLFPFRSAETVIATGEELNSMQWRSIEANVDIPVAWFSPPEFERTPLQTFTEQLMVQHSDPRSVLWTYHHFRRAHPELDTRVAAEVAGFQILKMGQLDTAIALLERNAADHPDAADSAFGLGRAYERAGRGDDARREFQRALALEPEHRRATRALAALDG